MANNKIIKLFSPLATFWSNPYIGVSRLWVQVGLQGYSEMGGYIVYKIWLSLHSTSSH